MKAQHHAAFDVLGDVAVRHPEARVGHVYQNVDRLTRADQECSTDRRGFGLLSGSLVRDSHRASLDEGVEARGEARLY
jgi:hypothetical protein